MPVARRGWTLPAAVAWAASGVVLALAGWALAGEPGDPLVLSAAATAAFSAVFAALLLTRSARHPIGWLFFVVGLTRGVAAAASVWSVEALVTHQGRPGGALASWLQLWTPSVGLALAPVEIVETVTTTIVEVSRARPKKLEPLLTAEELTAHAAFVAKELGDKAVWARA